MKKAIAMKWVKALRSGKYEQGKQYLNWGNKYCCLGILCEILGSPKEQPNPDNIASYDGFTTVVSPDYVLKAGLYSADGGLRSGSIAGYISLARANDSGISFSEIADYIEANYKLL